MESRCTPDGHPSVRHIRVTPLRDYSIVFNFSRLDVSSALVQGLTGDSWVGMKSAKAINDKFRTPGLMRRILILLAAVSALHAQDMLGPHPILMPGDMAVLDSGDPRKDLWCAVTPKKPLLGFDLKFHSGFSVDIPIRELVGPGNMLSIVFRVTPQATGAESGQDPVYFHEKFSVPPIADPGGTATL